MVQNTQATNLAQVLEVLWTKIAECIDEKKSMVLYFDACTVCSPGHVHARCRHAHRSTLQTHRHMRTRSARKGCKVRAERAVRRVTWPRRPCIRVSSHTHTHTLSLSLSLSLARARALSPSLSAVCPYTRLTHPQTRRCKTQWQSTGSRHTWMCARTAVKPSAPPSNFPPVRLCTNTRLSPCVYPRTQARTCVCARAGVPT